MSSSGTIGLVNTSGVEIYRASFDAWGNRTVTVPDAAQQPVPGTVTGSGSSKRYVPLRGFTGHEHYSECGLIDMNGRMYDPLTVRFLSPDPYVQMPYNPQNFNRYSYCLNNPLLYTDPDGETFGMTLFTSFTHLIVTCFRGGLNLFKKQTMTDAWSEYARIVKNSWKITIGNFKTDSNDKFGNRLYEIISRFGIGQGSQSHTGEAYAQLLNFFGRVESVDNYCGATLVETKNKSETSGATLGNYIIAHSGTQAICSDVTFQHEYGHVLQSRKYLVFYWFFAMASFITAWQMSQEHDTTYVEMDANRLAFKYFTKNIENFSEDRSEQYGDGAYSSFLWKWRINPVDKDKHAYYIIYEF